MHFVHHFIRQAVHENSGYPGLDVLPWRQVDRERVIHFSSSWLIF